MSAVIFDLDGTLVDSAPVLRDTANALMAELRLPPLDLAEARDYIGNGARVLVERALAARRAGSPDLLDAAHARFERLLAAAPGAANRPYPGVDEALRELRAAGHRLGLCTNKPGAATRVVIEALGWAGLLEAVISGDTLPVRKPDPAPLREAVGQLGGGAAVYVGDSEVDAATAEAAGLPFLLHTEGYRKVPAASLPHAATFAAFATLPGLVARQLGGSARHGA